MLGISLTTKRKATVNLRDRMDTLTLECGRRISKMVKVKRSGTMGLAMKVPSRMVRKPDGATSNGVMGASMREKSLTT